MGGTGRHIRARPHDGRVLRRVHVAARAALPHSRRPAPKTQPIRRTSDAVAPLTRKAWAMRRKRTDEVHELERIADTGGSSLTPVVLYVEVWVVCAVAVLVFLALALLAYRLA